MDPTKSEMSLAEMDYKGAFSKGRIYLFSSACASVSAFTASIMWGGKGKTQTWLCLFHSNK